jgi:hypothetical protein
MIAWKNSPDKGVDQLFINPQSKGRKHKKSTKENVIEEL